MSESPHEPVSDGGTDHARVSERTGGIEEIVDGRVTWRFDAAFLRSRWTCIWGRGCRGILSEPAEPLGQGCCSVGARLADADEERHIVGLAAMLDPEHFQFHAEAHADGVLGANGGATRIVDGACIFLNRPGFGGGAGCALHLDALADGVSPIDRKPAVCWQLPLRTDWVENDDGTETATVRRWTRADWGDEPLQWWCTEDKGAFVGEAPVVETLAEELEALAGREVAVELRRRLAGGG